MLGSAPRRGVGAARSRAAGQAGGRGREKASEPVCVALPALRREEEDERCRSGLREVCQCSNFGASGVNSEVRGEGACQPKPFREKGVCLPDPAALARGGSDFEDGNLAAAPGNFAHGFRSCTVCRLEGRLEAYGGRCCKEVAASVRGVAPREEFGPVHRSLKAGNVKGYFATYLRASGGCGEATHGARCLPSAATNREEPCRAPCVRAAGEGSASLPVMLGASKTKIPGANRSDALRFFIVSTLLWDVRGRSSGLMDVFVNSFVWVTFWVCSLLFVGNLGRDI